MEFRLIPNTILQFIAENGQDLDIIIKRHVALFGNISLVVTE